MMRNGLQDVYASLMILAHCTPDVDALISHVAKTGKNDGSSNRIRLKGSVIVLNTWTQESEFRVREGMKITMRLYTIYTIYTIGIANYILTLHVRAPECFGCNLIIICETQTKSPESSNEYLYKHYSRTRVPEPTAERKCAKERSIRGMLGKQHHFLVVHQTWSMTLGIPNTKPTHTSRSNTVNMDSDLWFQQIFNNMKIALRSISLSRCMCQFDCA